MFYYLPTCVRFCHYTAFCHYVPVHTFIPCLYVFSIPFYLLRYCCRYYVLSCYLPDSLHSCTGRLVFLRADLFCIPSCRLPGDLPTVPATASLHHHAIHCSRYTYHLFYHCHVYYYIPFDFTNYLFAIYTATLPADFHYLPHYYRSYTHCSFLPHCYYTISVPTPVTDRDLPL